MLVDHRGQEELVDSVVKIAFVVFPNLPGHHYIIVQRQHDLVLSGPVSPHHNSVLAAACDGHLAVSGWTRVEAMGRRHDVSLVYDSSATQEAVAIGTTWLGKNN